MCIWLPHVVSISSFMNSSQILAIHPKRICPLFFVEYFPRLERDDLASTDLYISSGAQSVALEGQATNTGSFPPNFFSTNASKPRRLEVSHFFLSLQII
jgi:hypothetical protein